jgi:hypothetical protein
MASSSIRARETFLEVAAQPDRGRLAEGVDASCRASTIRSRAFSAGADGAHAVVDAARAEAQLGDFEAAAFAEQDVVLQEHFHVRESGYACGHAERHPDRRRRASAFED